MGEFFSCWTVGPTLSENGKTRSWKQRRHKPPSCWKRYPQNKVSLNKALLKPYFLGVFPLGGPWLTSRPCEKKRVPPSCWKRSWAIIYLALPNQRRICFIKARGGVGVSIDSPVFRSLVRTEGSHAVWSWGYLKFPTSHRERAKELPSYPPGFEKRTS